MTQVEPFAPTLSQQQIERHQLSMCSSSHGPLYKNHRNPAFLHYYVFHLPTLYNLDWAKQWSSHPVSLAGSRLYRIFGCPLEPKIQIGRTRFVCCADIEKLATIYFSKQDHSRKSKICEKKKK